MNNYSEEVKKIFKKSESLMLELNHPYVGSEHLVLAFLSYENKVSDILNKYKISFNKYKSELLKLVGKSNKKSIFIFYTPTLKRIIELACINSREEDNSEISAVHLFISLLEISEGIGISILENLGVPLDSVYKKLKKIVTNDKKLLIYELGTNLNELAKNNELDKVIGREKETDRLIEILKRKNKNNPVLVGEAGVGKTAIVENLAYLIIKNDVPEFLKNKIIISLNMSVLIAGTKYRGEFEEKIGKIIKELENNENLILFIDEVHTLVGAGGAEGAIDASNILKPALARNKIRVIGATTLNEYKKFIEKDKALDRRLQKIYIEEPSEEETLNILKKIKTIYQNYHNVEISEEIIKLIVKLSKKYIYDRNEPDRSIDILDEVSAKSSILLKDKILKEKEKELEKIILEKNKLIVKNLFIEAKEFKKQENLLCLEIKELKKNKKVKVTKEILKTVLEFKSNSKIKELEEENNLKNIENFIKNKIIGQDEAIKKLIEINNTKDFDRKKPVSILFSGSTGVGKTETAKIYAEALGLNLIKLDMSEYKTEMSINRIIGSPQGYVGYDDVNTVFEVIKNKPYSLILLDQIDKADSSVINLFLNILDEGEFKNSKGEVIKFYNSIFILTTNNLIENNIVGFNYKQENDFELVSKDFINRIEYFIKFKNLTKFDIKNIIRSYNKNFNLKEIEEIIKESNYSLYGARKIKNIVQSKEKKKVIS